MLEVKEISVIIGIVTIFVVWFVMAKIFVYYLDI